VDYFDIVAGTATGGLITSMIASPESEGSKRPLFTARDVVQFYQKYANKIFPQNR
jgi:patatin-like phospholipase/acyl hydrolase